MVKCPLCSNNKIIYDPARGEYYCSNCGYVIDVEEEASINHHEPISSIITSNFSPSKRLNVIYIEKDVYRICSQLYLPKYLKEEALNLLFKKVAKIDLTGKHIRLESIAPALILLAAYIHHFSELDLLTLFYYSKAAPNEILNTYHKLYDLLRYCTKK